MKKISIAITNVLLVAVIVLVYYKDKEELVRLRRQVDELQRADVLYGKKWVACGDSFTAGDFAGLTDSTEFVFQDGLYEGELMVYPFFIGRRNNMEVVNEAICGSTMALWKEYVINPTEKSINGHTPFAYERYKKIPEDADYITLWFGINDARATILGSIADTTATTYYGAWNVVLPYLIAHHPYAKIGIIVTNQSTEEYRTATREVAKRWGIPYLDMMGDERIVPVFGKEDGLGLCSTADSLRRDAFQVTKENDHPNVAAHEFQSTIIEAWLRTL